jgi:multisubunit Na+/H+ antiporter MnhG subunit
VAGLVCSLVGFFVPFLGIIGLVLSIVGYRWAKRRDLAQGLSIAGIVIGIVSTTVGVLFILAFVAVAFRSR